MSKQEIKTYLEQINKQLIEYSEQIWHKPELSFAEHFAKDLYTKALTENDFTIKEFAKYPTAFLATYGKGKPVFL